MAALKRKRKKFSSSKNSSPVLDSVSINPDPSNERVKHFEFVSFNACCMHHFLFFPCSWNWVVLFSLQTIESFLMYSPIKYPVNRQPKIFLLPFVICIIIILFNLQIYWHCLNTQTEAHPLDQMIGLTTQNRNFPKLESNLEWKLLNKFFLMLSSHECFESRYE